MVRSSSARRLIEFGLSRLAYTYFDIVDCAEFTGGGVEVENFAVGYEAMEIHRVIY